ncbi:zinc ribbon domain-containing protein [Comamonas endophytica]|uniref:Zinc ribbon domain-containing protein n=1 Tax=Comamonas endophytica TaxID=2949090 RepID=A0ABY6GF16_9BURK|nr:MULTISPECIES: zinc ribbon domain-containing protein [unclassified Acidovorax]MCD2512688.1 zinc ribbon domain-containing protein [Acidovorax sp. D4N7]UYG52957.1 zinc ribbon domain-containing protein [Acidovorax sp. 5MLIR]
MSKALRLPEKWFRRGLWLVALVFASFLVGLGGLVVGDLPQVEEPQRIEDFMPPGRADQVRLEQETAERLHAQASSALEQAELRYRAAQKAYAGAREAFDNWVATRSATQRADQDTELLTRTRALDQLKQAERRAGVAVEAQQQQQLDAQQAVERALQTRHQLEEGASEQWRAAQRAQELRVFLYRLALTLPLLLVAGWLFARKRHSSWWPFVWGFIFFALFAFFVELVPYLPSYGGYVRYIVGIVLTMVLGRAAIQAYNRYLERQKLKEAMPDAERRIELSYDTALSRLGKGVCPGCERVVDLKDPGIDFCPHCGIGLFDHCGACNTRKSTFSRFCHACGTPAGDARPAVASVAAPDPLN